MNKTSLYAIKYISNQILKRTARPNFYFIFLICIHTRDLYILFIAIQGTKLYNRDPCLVSRERETDKTVSLDAPFLTNSFSLLLLTSLE